MSFEQLVMSAWRAGCAQWSNRQPRNYIICTMGGFHWSCGVQLFSRNEWGWQCTCSMKEICVRRPCSPKHIGLKDNYITKWAVLRAVGRLRGKGDCYVKSMGSQNVSWGIKTLQDLNAIYVLRFSLALCPRDITGLIRMSLQSERIPPFT